MCGIFEFLRDLRVSVVNSCRHTLLCAGSLNPCDNGGTNALRLHSRPQVRYVEPLPFSPSCCSSWAQFWLPAFRSRVSLQNYYQNRGRQSGHLSGFRAARRGRGRQQVRLLVGIARPGTFAAGIVLALAGEGRLRTGVPGATRSFAGECRAPADEMVRRQELRHLHAGAVTLRLASQPPGCAQLEQKIFELRECI